MAAKTAVLSPAATVTLAGTVKDPLLLLRLTVVALVTVWLNAAVQVLEALLLSVKGQQNTTESCADELGAVAVSVKA